MDDDAVVGSKKECTSIYLSIYQSINQSIYLYIYIYTLKSTEGTEPKWASIEVRSEKMYTIMRIFIWKSGGV